jgi:hypothetical protein
MTSDQPDAVLPWVTALIAPRADEAELIAETLLSLAAQTCDAFDVMIVVPEASAEALVPFRDLIAAFDVGFSERVRLTALPATRPESPLLLCARMSEARYISVVRPLDIVFGHWAETIATNGARADDRVLTFLTATQVVECEHRRGDPVVTTVGPPRSSEPTVSFDLLEFLDSPPGPALGCALPRHAVARALPPGLPAGTEEWAAQLIAFLANGSHDTGEVTYLRRVKEDTATSPHERAWERDRTEVLALLDHGTLTLGSGMLTALQSSHRRAAGERDDWCELEHQLAAAREACATHAAAEQTVRRQMEELRQSASWRLSAPLRALGGAARRLRRMP